MKETGYDLGRSESVLVEHSPNQARLTQDTGRIGRQIESVRVTLAATIADRHYLLHPEFDVRYGPPGRVKCREDASFHMTYLIGALTASSPVLFREYVTWAKTMLDKRGIPARDLAENLQVMIDVLKEHLSADDACVATGYVQAAMTDLVWAAAELPGHISTDQPHSQLAESYLASLLVLDRNKASRMILDTVNMGTSIKDIYIHVFQKSQREIGRLWQSNRITVAQEHYCTAATQMIMSQLYPRVFAEPRIGRRFVGACVGGDLHEIGLRMVADFLEMSGWDTVYLGASVPAADLIRTLEVHKPDIVGISANITPHISAVAKLISAIRATPICQDTKIIVGGYPFVAVPDLWQVVNADGTSVDAKDAVELANQLVGT